MAIKRKIKQIARSYLLRKRKMVDSLPPSVWGIQVNDKGCLVISGCDVIELAEKYSTPLFIINEDKARLNCKDLFHSFKSAFPNLEIFCSYKTNPVPGMIRIFHEEGLGAEVISGYELWLAFQLGVPPEKIIFNGLSKSIESLTRAINKGIKLINIDSYNEVEKIAQISERKNREISVGIRVITGFGWGGQFGFSIESGEAFEAINKIIRLNKLKFKGLHFHLGSGIKTPGIYCDALDIAFKFIFELKKKVGIEIEYLDIGGGFGVPTVKSISPYEQNLLNKFDIPLVPPKISGPPYYINFAGPISEKISGLCKYYGLAYPTIFIEPGRLLSSSAQILLLKVTDLKERKGMPKIAIMNGGINIASTISSAYYEAFLANRMNGNKKELYKVVGPLCNPDDVLYQAKYFSEMQLGDYLAIMDAGAYFVSNANNFSFPRPAIVIVSKNGHRLTRRRESFYDLVSKDNI